MIGLKSIDKLYLDYNYNSKLYFTYLSKDGQELEGYCKLFFRKTDYTLLAYPLHVLSTSRMCDTIISRSQAANKADGRLRMMQDFSNLRRMNSLYIGFFPYLLAYLVTSLDLQIWIKRESFYMKQMLELEQIKWAQKKIDEGRRQLYKSLDGRYHFKIYIALSMVGSVWHSMLVNAMNIVLLRTQNIEYRNNKSLLLAVKDVVVVDKHRMLYRGLVPTTFAFTHLISAKMQVRRMVADGDENQLAHLWLPVYLAMAALAHPWFVVSARVQFAPFCGNKVNNNTVDCLINLIRKEGFRGLYRGFAPSLIAYCLIGFPELKRGFEYSWFSI